MTQSEISNWDLRTRHLTKEDLIQIASLSEFRFYENQLPDGPVLDIGPGLGYEAFYFAEKKRKVVVVDKEPYFLNRINELDNEIVTIESEMPYGRLPNEQYSLAILSNLLHFMSHTDAQLLCSRVTSLLPSKSYILIRVHSQGHPYADTSHLKHNNFSHFFSEADVLNLLPSLEFEVIWLSDCLRDLSEREVKLFGLEPHEVHKKGSITIIAQRK